MSLPFISLSNLDVVVYPSMWDWADGKEELEEKSNNKHIEKVAEDLEKFVNNLQNENEIEALL